MADSVVSKTTMLGKEDSFIFWRNINNKVKKTKQIKIKREGRVVILTAI